MKQKQLKTKRCVQSKGQKKKTNSSSAQLFLQDKKREGQSKENGVSAVLMENVNASGGMKEYFHMKPM